MQSARRRKQSTYATCTFPIMHLVCLPPSPPPPPHQILHNLGFSFLLGITVAPREIENNAYAKFLRANKVHYGRCTSGAWPRKEALLDGGGVGGGGGGYACPQTEFYKLSCAVCLPCVLTLASFFFIYSATFATFH